MGALTEHCRVFYFGTKTDVGAGALADWEVDANFEDRFGEGHATPGTNENAGNEQHDHTGVSHHHHGYTHSHTLDSGPTTNKAVSTVTVTGFPTAGTDHEHAGETGEESVDAALAQVHTQLSATTTRPPSKSAFWIKPKSSEIPDVPDDCVVFTDSASTPAGFDLCDGDDGRPSLDGKYIVGAPSTATDGDVASGAATHPHTVLPHTHDIDPHDHDDCDFDGPDTFGNGGVGLLIAAHGSQTHTCTNISTSSGQTTEAGAITVNSASNKPDHYKLLAVQNTSGGELTPVGTILAFMAAGGLPTNWAECDGTNGLPDLVGKQIECTVTGGSIGDGGIAGTNIHTHTATGPHGHVLPSHTHTCDINAGSQGIEATDFKAFSASWNHTHPSPTMSSEVPTVDDATPTWLNEDGRCPYRTVRWIRYGGVTYKRAHAGTMAKTSKEVLAA